MEKLPWRDALLSGSLDQTGKDAVGCESALGSGSEAYLSEDDQMSERLFRVIVSGGHAGAPEEGKEKFLLGTCEIGSEGLCGFETKRSFAQVAQFCDEALFDLGCRLPGDISGFELLRRVAES